MVFSLKTIKKTTGFTLFSLKHAEQALVLLCFRSKMTKPLVLWCFRSKVLKKHWFYCGFAQKGWKTIGFIIKMQKK